MLRNYITDVCLWVISKANRYKDRCLASRLYDMSLSYDQHLGCDTDAITVGGLVEKLSAVPQDKIVVLGDVNCNVWDRELLQIFTPKNSNSVFLRAELDFGSLLSIIFG